MEGTWKQAFEHAAQNLLLMEIMRGMFVAFSYIFAPKATLFYPFEKGYLSPRFRGEHALRRYPTGNSTEVNGKLSQEKNDALLVNYAKLSAPHKLLLSKQNQERMVLEEQQDTILI